jgi:OOP family OmpA-OmpF porin
MNFRNALVAATILALPVAAQAQPLSGWYIAGGAGANLMLDENVKVNSVGGSGSGHFKSTVGPALDLSVGYGLGNGLRAEVEGLYTYNAFNGVSGGGATGGGHEQKFGAFANVLYDFVGLSPYIQPYVGVGAGYLWAKETGLYIHSPGFISSASNDTECSFAYQGIIGAAIPIAGAPGLAVTADYRFVGMAGDRNYSGTVNHAAANYKLDSNYNNIFTVGFRYAFGAPAPAPMAPAPAMVPASPVTRSYLVFFDWDKADLTARARQIVAEAAANSTKVQYTRLEVNGYTDTSGTPQYNQGLSIRRAQSVAAELVKDGVPKSAISIQGFGETHLLVATGPGVREPQNRRVEIIIK